MKKRMETMAEEVRVPFCHLFSFDQGGLRHLSPVITLNK